MAQSVFNWVVVFENWEDNKEVKYYTCTWDELLEQLSTEREVVSIVRTGLKW